MQQNGALCAEAGDYGCITQHIFTQQNGQHLDRITPTEHVVEANGVRLGVTWCGVDTVGDANLFTHAVTSKREPRRPRPFGKIGHRLKARARRLRDLTTLRVQSCQSHSAA